MVYLVHKADRRRFEGIVLGQVNPHLPYSTLVRRCNVIQVHDIISNERIRNVSLLCKIDDQRKNIVLQNRNNFSFLKNKLEEYFKGEFNSIKLHAKYLLGIRKSLLDPECCVFLKFSSCKLSIKNIYHVIRANSSYHSRYRKLSARIKVKKLFGHVFDC